MPSGFGEVTRWPPRTLWSAWSRASRPAAWRSSSAWPSPPTSAIAEQEVLGRDVLVAEALGLGLGQLDDAPGARIHRQRAALDPRAPGEDRGQLAAEAGQVDAEPAERLGRDAVVGLDERGQDVLGVEDRAVEPLGGGLGGDDGLLGLLGESFELHVVSLAQRGSGWSTRSKKVSAAAARLVGQAGRQDDPGLDVQVAVPGRLEPGHALAGEPERPARSGSRPGS